MVRANIGCAIAVTVVVAAAAAAGATGSSPSRTLRAPREKLTGKSAQTVHATGEFVATAQAVTPSVRVNGVTTGGQHVPAVTVGPSGQVYVAWVDCPAEQNCEQAPAAPRDIYFARSTDGGQHFSARVLVSDDGSGAFANAPKIATDQDGTIYIVWHDDRAASVSDDSWDVYLSRSTDGGQTFHRASGSTSKSPTRTSTNPTSRSPRPARFTYLGDANTSMTSSSSRIPTCTSPSRWMAARASGPTSR